MAADTEPIEILLHLPLLAEDKVYIVHYQPRQLKQHHFSKDLIKTFACCRMYPMYLFLLRLLWDEPVVFPDQ